MLLPTISATRRKAWGAMSNEISVTYNLPENLNDAANLSFDQLSDAIVELHSSAQISAIKAINRFATVRNYLIGFYIVEYEQHGSDRAKYGDRLIKRLAEKINRRGLNETLLKTSRAFYLNYPQIQRYLFSKSATASHLLSEKSPMASDFSELVSATIADAFKFETDAEQLISKLSFSHIREIMTVDDKLARFFYETECIKCCWSVQELRRQIATNLFFRSGISKNPQKLCGNLALYQKRQKDGRICARWHGQQTVCFYLHAHTPRHKDAGRILAERNGADDGKYKITKTAYKE